MNALWTLRLTSARVMVFQHQMPYMWLLRLILARRNLLPMIRVSEKLRKSLSSCCNKNVVCYFSDLPRIYILMEEWPSGRRRGFVLSKAEGWPSGLRRRSRKPVGEKSSREFESHLLRQLGNEILNKQHPYKLKFVRML